MLSEVSSHSDASLAERVASRRTLRLGFGLGLSLLFSQVVNWDISFIAPIVTMFLLATPMPVPSLKQGIGVLLLLLLPIFAGMALIPFLYYARWAGVILVAIALYYSFYFTAKGGSPVVGTFFTIGLTLIVTVGSVSIDLLLMLINGLSLGVVFGLLFVWVAHAALPDIPVNPELLPAQARPTSGKSTAEINRDAMRAMLVTFPIALILLFSSNSLGYIVVMMKTAAMGQQASSSESREMGKSLLQSTLFGGAAAILAWQWLSIWPNIIPYTLLVAITALIFGRRIFKGFALDANASTWNYGLLTFLVILLPAVTDSQTGSAAGESFYLRLALILLIAVYGTVSVKVFDSFWTKPSSTRA